MTVWAVIAAAGAGARMGAEMNKTLLPLGGVPAISYSVRTLKAVCDGVVLAVCEEEQPLFEAALREQGLSVDLYAPGGDTRQDTVQNALAHLPEACGIVLVHDGARPLASQALIRRVIGSARTLGSGVPALPPFRYDQTPGARRAQRGHGAARLAARCADAPGLSKAPAATGICRGPA